VVVEEAQEYYVIVDDKNDETTCRKTRFEIIEDGGITKNARATITELTYQIDNNFKDIKKLDIRKNSKGEIKEISIKFKYN
jgi:Zn-finger domain-containing protein